MRLYLFWLYFDSTDTDFWDFIVTRGHWTCMRSLDSSVINASWCVCVCVCVSEREREREKETEKDRERERQRQREREKGERRESFMCTYVYMLMRQVWSLFGCMYLLSCACKKLNTVPQITTWCNYAPQCNKYVFFLAYHLFFLFCQRYYLNGGDAFRLKLWFPGVAYYSWT